MSKKPVAISRLADYASDPEGFIARDGAVRNPEAGVYGDRAHRNAASGRRTFRWKTAVLLLVTYGVAVLAALLLLGYFFGGGLRS